MGLFGLFGCSEKPDLDQLVLNHLQKAGSDLSKPHVIDCYLYFPTQAAANEAAARLRERGFRVEVRPAAKGADWLCLATTTMIPRLSDLHEIRRKCNDLAVSLKGEYDGWETAVEK